MLDSKIGCPKMNLNCSQLEDYTLAGKPIYEGLGQKAICIKGVTVDCIKKTTQFMSVRLLPESPPL